MRLPDSRQCCWHSCTARRQEVRFGRQGKTSRYVLQTYNNNNAWVRTRIGIGIGVYLRSCICSKMSKLGFPCIGLEIGLGHILCNISFLDIDMMASLSIGNWNWIGVYLRSCIYVQRCRNWGLYVLDWKLDWVESYALFHF